MQTIRMEHPEMKGKELMLAAVVKWNEEKANRRDMSNLYESHNEQVVSNEFP
jgi:hypothetical protein